MVVKSLLEDIGPEDWLDSNVNLKFLSKGNKRGQGQQFTIVKCFLCRKEYAIRLTMFKYKERHKIGCFCSRECYAKYRYSSEIRTCFQCKTLFKCWVSSRRKFCSRKCYDTCQKDSCEKRQCLWCGQVFETWDKGNQRYCCKRCAFASTGETDIEKIFREELDKKGFRYEQYRKIGPFFVDFYLPDQNIIIECDGIHWHTKPEVIKRDIRKNQQLQNDGFKLFRFTDKEIKQDIDRCIKKIGIC